jgi:hypothetical protein
MARRAHLARTRSGHVGVPRGTAARRVLPR